MTHKATHLGKNTMSLKRDTFQVAGSNVETTVIIGEEITPEVRQRLSCASPNMQQVKRTPEVEALMTPLITCELLESDGELIGETYNGNIKAFTYQGKEYSTYQGEKVYATRQFYDKHVLAWNTEYSFTDADRAYFAKQLISYTRGNVFDA